MYVAGTNMPGFMPDNEPAEFATFDEAKRYIIGIIKNDEEQVDTEDAAEELCHFAEDVNLQSGEFSARCQRTVYWVKTL